MYKSLILFIVLMLCSNTTAQEVTIAGIVTDEDTHSPIEFASILMKENGQWAISAADGSFCINKVPTGKTTITIQCLGYASRHIILNITRDIPRLRFTLKQDNLKLNEITITAKRKENEVSTSYTIDRTALDNQQILNLSDITTLLPGGKSNNPTLMDDSRIALRSGVQEKGNASFATAIEVDGIRLGSNAETNEIAGASTRTVSTSDIESIEVITGIPSVEYGDLSNGMVKVNTRKGKSPFIIDGKQNQHTRQIAINKGFDLGHKAGIMNVSIEHAKSFTDAASPYTAYQRNIMSMHYMNVFLREKTPLTLNIGVTGNIGGFNKENDPDNDLDNYTKTSDNTLRANMNMQWLLNKSWITNLSLYSTFSTSNHTTEDYKNANSATTLPYNHSFKEGYYIATDYDSNPKSPVILGPTGYWHVKSHLDSHPTNWSVKLKYDWTRRFSSLLSRTMAGFEYTGSYNSGKGKYYDDMRYAEDGWREYKYNELPTLHNIALYAEEKISLTKKISTIELTAGIREDITHISGSEYGTVSSISPRINGRYIIWQNNRKHFITDLVLHAGWGKSVKLPSFQILYPSPSYFDVSVFSTPSTSDNTSFTAVYTRPNMAVYNRKLKWQHTKQTDIGIEMKLYDTHISLSAFHHRTYNPYIARQIYTPISYIYTPTSALNGITIPSANRIYTISSEGFIIVSDATGTQEPIRLTTYQDKDGRTHVITPTKTFNSTLQYTNGSSIDRYGIEWMIDLKTIKALKTDIRFDGIFYYYKGLDNQIYAYLPQNAKVRNTDDPNRQDPYKYIGWYRGTDATSGVASASVSNGSLSQQLNLNTTITTHIPKIRLIVALRLESTLYSYRRALSEDNNGSSRAITLADKGDYTGTIYRGEKNHYLAIYPEYYSTWDNTEEMIPFAEKFLWAKDNDPLLYNDLANLVVKTNNSYMLNPNRLSAYYSANISVTKEIGDHVSVSFYANNFFNNMKMVHSSQTNTKSSLFSIGYIPSYYYGLSLRLKI